MGFISDFLKGVAMGCVVFFFCLGVGAWMFMMFKLYHL